ncbi:MAG: ABC transporter substrate binding protein, partial [Oscillospiraceae bacterium]
PVVAGERGPVEGGALATYGITYYKIGYQTGLMAVEILTKGADISKMPVAVSTEYDYCVNGTVAEALGLTVPEDLKEFVITPEG